MSKLSLKLTNPSFVIFWPVLATLVKKQQQIYC